MVIPCGISFGAEPIMSVVSDCGLSVSQMHLQNEISSADRKLQSVIDYCEKDPRQSIFRFAPGSAEPLCHVTRYLSIVYDRKLDASSLANPSGLQKTCNQEKEKEKDSKSTDFSPAEGAFFLVLPFRFPTCQASAKLLPSFPPFSSTIRYVRYLGTLGTRYPAPKLLSFTACTP